MTKTIAASLLLALSLAACGQEPSTLTVQGLPGLLTETERAGLKLEGETLDLREARFTQALDRDAREWVLERGSVLVRVAVEQGLGIELRGEHSSCEGQMTEEGLDLVWALAGGPSDLEALKALMTKVPRQPSFVAGHGFVTAAGMLTCEQGPRVFVLDLHDEAISGGVW